MHPSEVDRGSPFERPHPVGETDAGESSVTRNPARARRAQLSARRCSDGGGIFGVVSVLVIADLTRGTGRFNLTLGAITTAVGIGAALSQTLAGSLVHHLGYHAGFLFLAGVASVALAVLYLFMPETNQKRPLSPAP
jgi:hypothetical protein